MDKRSPKLAKLRVWQPRSRIAGYIKGEVKLEDIVRGDKLVRPEHRHNKRAFLQNLNDDNEKCRRRTCETKTSSRNSSRIRPCSSSVKTSASKVTVSDNDHLAQTIIDKNEQISQLQRQIETFRECVRTTEVQQDDEVEAAISTLLDCLANLAEALQNVDSSDERIADFVKKVQRERQRWFTFATSVQEEVRILRHLNENLQKSNVKKDDRMNEIAADNSRLQIKLKTLKDDFERLQGANARMRQVYENIIENKNDSHKRNEELRDRVTEYERMYEGTARELSLLSELSERVRHQFLADKRAVDEANLATRHRVRELEEKIRGLEEACRRLEDSKYKAKEHVAEIERHHHNEIQTLKEANEKCVTSLKHETSTLEREIKQLRDDERSLRQENDNLRTTLLQLSNKYRILNEDAEHAKYEKETLEEALRSLNKSSDITKVKEKLNNALLELEETRLLKLMQYLEDTIRSTELLPEETIR